MDNALDFADIENLEMLEYIERRRRLDPAERAECDLDVMDQTDFRSRYRLSKETVENLIPLLDGKLKSGSNKNSPLSTAEKICMALRFYATGAFQTVIGDLSFVSQPSTCRAINDVSKCLAELRPIYVKLPATEFERREVSQKFYHMSGFPSVYGALDCSHIPILNPGGALAEKFRCRKGYFSFNVQTLSDASLFIRHIVACWPGSTHDSTIFDNSHLRAVLETEIPPSYHAIGDNGYACRSYLLTPFLDVSNNQQRRYNVAHIKARNVVERQYGVWKRRFSCLSTPLRCHTENVMTIIVATSVLHNIALTMNDNWDIEDDDDNVQYNVLQNASVMDQTAGIAKRNAVVNTFFN